MNCQQFCDQIAEIFYGDVSESILSTVVQHRQTCSACAKAWQNLETISKAFRSLEEQAPSQISINKILVHARERVERKAESVWQRLFRPALAFSFLVALSTAGYLNFQQETPQPVAHLDMPSPSPSTLRDRLYQTPFDRGGFSGDYQLNRFLSSDAQISSASQGSSHSFDIGDELDVKMMGRDLDVHELESVYYRARKMEKLGYYREAFNDFEFITRFYPNYENTRSILLSMARCLQNLDQRDEAVATLKRYKSSYGSTQEIDTWIDQLKSETF